MAKKDEQATGGRGKQRQKPAKQSDQATPPEQAGAVSNASNKL